MQFLAIAVALLGAVGGAAAAAPALSNPQVGLPGGTQVEISEFRIYLTTTRQIETMLMELKMGEIDATCVFDASVDNKNGRTPDLISCGKTGFQIRVLRSFGRQKLDIIFMDPQSGLERYATLPFPKSTCRRRYKTRFGLKLKVLHPRRPDFFPGSLDIGLT